MNEEVKSFLVFVFVIMIMIMLIGGCVYDCHKNKVIHAREKTPIEAVYYHEGHSYSVAVKQGNIIEIIPVPMTWSKKDKKYTVTIINDVMDDEKSWVAWEYSNIIGKEGWAEIHIRDMNDIQGGRWNHGKFGHGQTNRIQ